MADIITDVLKYLLDMFKGGAGDVFRLVEYLPDILRESGSMFGVFALVAIIIAVMMVVFFRNAETKQKERMYIYTSLFLMALVFSALIAGASTGFSTGREIAITDPALVELSPSTVKALENYLQAEGQNITDKNKSRVLSEAISAYFEGSTVEANALSQSIDASASGATDENSEYEVTVGASASSAPDGFIFQSRGCSQRDSVISCDTLVTNTEEDTRLFLFADDYSADSRLVDGDGNQYVVDTIKVGNEQSRGQVVPFAHKVPVKVTLIVTEADSKASQISLIELLGTTGRPRDGANASFQVRDVRVR